jgi:hypothetical protein
VKYAILLDSFSLTVSMDNSIHKVHISILFDMNEEKNSVFMHVFKRGFLLFAKQVKGTAKQVKGTFDRGYKKHCFRVALLP